MVSKQRARIALRSFPTLAAAAASVGCGPRVLARMRDTDPELRKAFEARGGRNVAVSQLDEVPVPTAITEYEVRRRIRMRAGIAFEQGGSGPPPIVAIARMHFRQETAKRAAKRRAVDDALLRESAAVVPAAPRAMSIAADRWCACCRTHVTEDPCENCNRKTREVEAP